MDAYSSDEEKIEQPKSEEKIEQPKSEENIEQPKSEVEIHLEVRKDACARYMNMLLDRAHEILEEKDDPQEECGEEEEDD